MWRGGLVIIALGGLPALAHEPTTDAQKTAILKSLAEAGCSAKPENIIEHMGGFQALEADCADGTYTVMLDTKFAIFNKIKQ